jgi:DNA-binding transcriptional MerR regulator
MTEDELRAYANRMLTQTEDEEIVGRYILALLNEGFSVSAIYALLEEEQEDEELKCPTIDVVLDDMDAEERKTA